MLGLLFNKLPDDLIDLIREYIPDKYFIFTNTYYYNLYHHLLRDRIPIYYTFIRDVIRRDNEYVFSIVARENIYEWISKKNYVYKNMVFSNYIYFIINYCIENGSDKCRNVLNEYSEIRELCRNQHKKNVIKYING